MFDGVRDFTISVLIWFLRYRHVPDIRLATRVHHWLNVGNGLFNGLMAACGGYMLVYYLQHNLFLAWKIAACLVAVGYHLRVIPAQNYNRLITTLLSRMPPRA